MLFKKDFEKAIEKLEDKEAERITKTLYTMLGNAIGPVQARNILKVSESDLKGKAPGKTLGKIMENLEKSVGTQTMNNMLYVTVKEEFSEPESGNVLAKLGIQSIDRPHGD